MMIEWLGSIGLGAIWGWLAGITFGRARLAWPHISLLAGATLILLAEVVWLIDWPAMIACIAATLLAGLAYLSWMRVLRRRADASK